MRYSQLCWMGLAAVQLVQVLARVAPQTVGSPTIQLQRPVLRVERPGSDQHTGPFGSKGPDRDCGDFSTHAKAQAFFEAAGGPASDPHRLDGDNDGIACEICRRD